MRRKLYAVSYTSATAYPKGAQHIMVFSETLPAYIFLKNCKDKGARVFQADFLLSHIARSKSSGQWMYRMPKSKYEQLYINIRYI